MSEKDRVSLPHIRNFISGLPYPSNREDIIEYARNKGANTGILDVLEKIPDQFYENEPHIISHLDIKE